jgi:hypothetical protein
MCRALRGDHGQAARLATNYDGLIISVLAEAQADGAPQRKAAGRCALRGMRKADVAVEVPPSSRTGRSQRPSLKGDGGEMAQGKCYTPEFKEQAVKMVVGLDCTYDLFHTL